MAITVEMREQVSQLYVALFGRAPDGEGLGYWVGLLSEGQSMTQVANTMYATAPARDYYPSFLTNQEIIESFYENVLGRTADAEGLAFWTAKLNASGATPGSVITEMINVVANYTGTDADGIKSAALFNARAEVAQAYGEANGGIAGATNPIQAITYGEVAAINAQKALELAAIASGSASRGDTFTLTASADNIVGTSGNDAINGNVDGDNDTLTLGDLINGGAGVDTLTIFTEGADTVNLARATISGVENLIIDARDGELNTVEANSNAFSAVTFKGNGREFGAFALNDVAANAAVTIENADFGGEDVDVLLTEQATGINGSLTLKNVTGATVWVGVDEGKDGSAADDTYTITLDNVQLGGGEGDTASVYISDIETLNVVVANDSELDSIGNFYNMDDSEMGDVTVNLTANADLTVGFWDLNDDEGDDQNTTFNITGAGNVTITSFDDGDSNVTVNAATATGNITLGDMDAHFVSVTTGSGDDSVEINASSTVVALGAGADTLILNDQLYINADEDAIDADLDGGAGDADTLEISAANAILSEAELNDDVTDFTDAVVGFEKLSLTGVAAAGAAVDATLWAIDDVTIDGVAAEAEGTTSFTLTIADAGMVTTTGSTGGDESLVVVVDGADEDGADDNSLTFSLNGTNGVDFVADISDVETIDLVSTGSDIDAEEPGTNNLALTADEAVTLNITGDLALDLTGSSFTALETVAAADFDAGLTIDVSSSGEAVSITTGDGDDVIIGSAQNDTIVVGNGANEVTGGAGKDTITLGSGVTAGDEDTINFTAVTDSQGVTVDVINGFQSGVQSTDDINEDGEVTSADVINDVLSFTLNFGEEPTLTGYLGEAEGYGAVLTSLISGEVTAVLDSTTNILYVDVDGSATLDNNDMAIKLTGVTSLDAEANFNWINTYVPA